MKFTITDNQNYCSFGDGIIYEFFSVPKGKNIPTCCKCIFSCQRSEPSNAKKCILAPCNPYNRKDNKDGFWKQSLNVNFETCASMFD